MAKPENIMSKENTKNETEERVGSTDLLGGDARFHELMHRLRETGIGKSVSASEWNEVTEFIDENIPTEDRIQKEYECGWKVGNKQAREEIKTWLINKAADHFKSGKDDEAKRLRELANTIAA